MDFGWFLWSMNETFVMYKVSVDVPFILERWSGEEVVEGAETSNLHLGTLTNNS